MLKINLIPTYITNRDVNLRTIDPEKINKATDNAVIGNVESVAKQIVERFDSNDRLMCWFDFFNHDSNRVIRNMEAFMTKVAPRVNGGN